MKAIVYREKQGEGVHESGWVYMVRIPDAVEPRKPPQWAQRLNTHDADGGSVEQAVEEAKKVLADKGFAVEEIVVE